MFFISSSYLSDAAIIDKTNVVIENASIQNLTFSYCIIKLKVKISNPTSEHISDLTADFDVFISDTDVGDGVVTKLSIPARSNEISDVYITIYYSSVGSAVINVLQTGNFDLTIKGEAKASILFNILTIKKPFTSSYSVT
jgi:LEA14-like dessication related protein